LILVLLANSAGAQDFSSDSIRAVYSNASPDFVKANALIELGRHYGRIGLDYSDRLFFYGHG